ncbi:T9SS type A sorting domain-containing protein [Bacteroidales bacterium OttesenSCG-928-B11]|nr:T9SS type A sorting domain-containing protein [Bacteroidales bacterium OttesenSCG-928-C03]MDL2312652.1 T9SS type A sorting domain-containing protein [Bacteroidales bacterium OttesenSCG-928-B11]MDL2326123.1 T9SS type A sorting domain-containing protein [Bacteroidales bacterium OttesenSCG-928-A14]
MTAFVIIVLVIYMAFLLFTWRAKPPVKPKQYKTAKGGSVSDAIPAYVETDDFSKKRFVFNGEIVDSNFANEINLTPGFTGIAGFHAEGRDAFPYFGNTIIRDPLFSCTELPPSKSANISDNNEELLLKDVIHDSNIKIYPNPTEGIVHIEQNLNTVEAITITDILGKVIYTNNKISENDLDINISNQTKGLYLFHIRTSSEIKTYKILLQ